MDTGLFMPDTVGDKAGKIIPYSFIILSSYSSPPPHPHPASPCSSRPSLAPLPPPPPSPASPSCSSRPSLPPSPSPPRLFCFYNNFSGKIIKSVPHILKKEVNIINLHTISQLSI